MRLKNSRKRKFLRGELSFKKFCFKLFLNFYYIRFSKHRFNKFELLSWFLNGWIRQRIYQKNLYKKQIKQIPCRHFYGKTFFSIKPFTNSNWLFYGSPYYFLPSFTVCRTVWFHFLEKNRLILSSSRKSKGFRTVV